MLVLVLILIVAAVIIVSVKESGDKKAAELRSNEENRQKRIKDANDWIDKDIGYVREYMRRFFNEYYHTIDSKAHGYLHTGATGGHYAYSDMQRAISVIDEKNEIIVKEGGRSREDDIHAIKEDVSRFGDLVSLLNKIEFPEMFDGDRYGHVNEVYWDQIKKMDIAEADQIIGSYDKWIRDLETDKFRSIIPSYIPMCVWRYAMEKPFSSEKFFKATRVFTSLYKGTNTDFKIAYYYAVYQFGGDEVLKEQVSKLLSLYAVESDYDLIAVASAMNWMGAYDVEKMILHKLVGYRMPETVQNRLAELSGSKERSDFS